MVDIYTWTKDRIKSLYSNVSNWEDKDETTPNHGTWSIKKLIALDYYIESCIKIYRKNGYNPIFVDPFCGSGLYTIDNKYRFPGSSLVALYNKYRFDKYILSDISKKYINLIQKRINGHSLGHNNLISIEKKDVNEKINELFGTIAKEKEGFLVFLDPFGLDIQWKSMKLLLNYGAVDIIMTLHSEGIYRNTNAKQSELKLELFFGERINTEFNTMDDIISLYRNKIECEGKDEKYNVFSSKVETDGQRYDLILASRSRGASNVFSAMENRINKIDKNLLNDAFDVTIGKTNDLTKWF